MKSFFPFFGFRLPRLLVFHEGMGNVEYTQPPAVGASGLPFAGAINGTSQNAFGQVVLGNDAGGTVGQLLSNREIPMNGFSLMLRDIGTAVSSFFILKSAAGRSATTPFEQFQDSGGGELLSFRVVDNTSFSIGGQSTGSSNAGAANQRSVVLGDGSAVSATVLNQVIVIGYQAMNLVATPSTNSIAIGHFTLQSSTGANNFVVGHSGMVNLTTGARNSGFGRSILAKNTTGNDNVAIGDNAAAESLVATTNPSNQVAIGSGALQQQNYGNGHIAIGFQCLFGGTGNAAGTNIVAIGTSTLSSGGLSGSNCVFIGGSIVASGGGTSYGSNVIWIGANGTLTGAATVSNITVIGQGITIGNVPNIVVLGRADQDIIIGTTTSPTDNGSKLQVLGGLSLPLRSTAVNTSLTFGADHTLILTAGALTITLPALAAGANGIFAIVNQAAASTTGTNYVNKAGASVNTIPANSALWLQANGAANWQQIN